MFLVIVSSVFVSMLCNFNLDKDLICLPVFLGLNKNNNISFIFTNQKSIIGFIIQYLIYNYGPQSLILGVTLH